MKSEKVTFQSVDEYIGTFPESIQEMLEELRATIKAAAPGAQERISYNLPTFTLNGTYLVYLAGWKNHIAVYPIPAGTKAFQKEVAQHVDGKGTLKFPIGKPLPLKLITKVVKFRAAETLKKNKRK
jgi:uncharacterized protein YdhG (YjbR/CyaY superfamily)